MLNFSHLVRPSIESLINAVPMSVRIGGCIGLALCTPSILVKINSNMPTSSTNSPLLKRAKSILKSSTMGLIIGTISKVLQPYSAPAPWHFFIWFTVADQIRRLINKYIYKGYLQYEKYLQQLASEPNRTPSLLERFHLTVFQVIKIKNQLLRRIDRAICSLLGMDVNRVLTLKTIKNLSYFEHVRFSLWPLLKSDILTILSSNLANALLAGAGLSIVLANIPLKLYLQSTAIYLLAKPLLYLANKGFQNWCRQDEKNHSALLMLLSKAAQDFYERTMISI